MSLLVYLSGLGAPASFNAGNVKPAAPASVQHLMVMVAESPIEESQKRL
jgi:hypothetical protein